ncbi:MFS transporter [Paraburkholderia dilworthii]|uniref:MFS transporter n=1 Tax=Paraburkholderia dilworthii TaxID=948106 RepID=UPI000404A526|nr:MFS transporter [Paraburkholderia dilworthii]
MHNDSIDVNDELSDAPVGRMHIKLGILLALMTLFDGYDTFNPAYVIHYVRGPWLLSLQQAGLLVSSGLVGFLFGAAIHGAIADRFGRRITLIAGLWITTVFSVLTALAADTFASFCTLRVLTGLGLGVLLPLATTYINELAPRRVENTFALWGVALGWAAGGAAAGLVGVFLTPHTGWQGLYWIGSLSILLIPFVHLYLPESPKFALLRGRESEVRGILAKLRPERAHLYQTLSIRKPLVPEKAPVLALLAAPYRRLSIAIWLTSFLSLFCIFGLSGWIPTLMQARGESFGMSFAFGALMQVMSFVGGLVCGRLVDRTGHPRFWLCMWWAAGALSVLALVFLQSHWVNLVCSAMAGFCIIGGQFVLNNFTAASYETRMRATAVGMELAVGRLGAILGPFIGGALQQIFGGTQAMLLAIVIAAGGAAVTVRFATRSAGCRFDSRGEADDVATATGITSANGLNQELG